MKAYMQKNNVEEEMTHIIALTSYTNKDQECKDAGMKNLFNKPVRFKDLFKVVWRNHYRVSSEDYRHKYEQRFEYKSGGTGSSVNLSL